LRTAWEDDEVQKGETTEKYKHTVSVKVDRPGKLRVDTTGYNAPHKSNHLIQFSYSKC
jgi:hypothetical protein